MEQIIYCPVCNSSSFSKHLECKDFTVSQEEFQLDLCECGFLFTNPRPKPIEIGSYYKSEDYISHTNSSKGLINKVYQFARKRAIAKKLSLINSLRPKLKVLIDYGCGTGEFLNAAAKEGWAVTGFEPDESARNQAIRNYNLNVFTPDSLQNIATGSAGIITLWHVLEHVHLLNETLSEFNRIIEPEGYLIIAVPNAASADAQHYGKYWAAYDVPRHLYHFTRPVMNKLLLKHNFNPVKTEGMFFDPFYISLLSEKYKNGSGNLISAALSGLRTTLKASSDIDANSSLLYIFQKS